MTRIELRETKHHIVQCEMCGRVRLSSGIWTWVDFAVPEVMGYCETCGEFREKARSLRGNRERREFHRMVDSSAVGDPFIGFREEEK